MTPTQRTELERLVDGLEEAHRERVGVGEYWGSGISMEDAVRAHADARARLVSFVESIAAVQLSNVTISGQRGVLVAAGAGGLVIRGGTIRGGPTR